MGAARRIAKAPLRGIGGKSSYYLRSDCFGFGRKGCKDRKGV